MFPLLWSAGCHSGHISVTHLSSLTGGPRPQLAEGCGLKWELGPGRVGRRGCMVWRTPGDGAQTTPSAASGQRGPSSSAGPFQRPAERPRWLSLWRLPSVPRPPQDQALAGEQAPNPALTRLVAPNALPSPRGTELRQHRSSYREKLKPFQQMGREGASSTGVTSLGRRARGTSE